MTQTPPRPAGRSLRLAVIGAHGQVGQEFTKLYPRERLQMFGREDVDVSKKSSVEDLFRRIESDVVVNLAAFHNTEECEGKPETALAVNAVGAHNVAVECAKRSIVCCFFSSDYVFGGAQPGRRAEYTEEDPPSPVNVYGVSKSAGESLVRVAAARHLIVRTSSLFGAVTSKKGWTFPQMIFRKAERKEPLRVVNDQWMAPTYTFDLVRRCIELLEAGAEGTVHITNSGACTWWEFASASLKLAGVDYPIEAVPSTAFPTKAKRPAYSAMKSVRTGEFALGATRHWKDALEAYLVETGVLVHHP